MKTETAVDNRAVSPLFRECGGSGRAPRADESLRADAAAMHFGEYATLATLVPLGVAAHAFEALWRMGGGRAAAFGFLPLALLLLHLLPLALQIRSPRVAFWVWGGLLAAGGAGFLANSELAAVRVIGAIWPIFMALQAATLAVPLWRRLMAVSGGRGTALRLLLGIGAHVAAGAIGWRWGWPAGAGVLGAALAVWAVGTFAPGSRIFGPVARRVSGPGVLLSLDDGPDPDDTPAILDALDAAGARAVFFVIGEKVRAHPELAREIVARGHELGNHTMTHPQKSMWALGPRRTRREIADCQREIEAATGVRPRWFRAPVGHRNGFTHPVTAELGLEVVAWSRRAYDTRETDVAKIVRKLTADAAPGDVLLLHEATPVAREVVAGVLAALGRRPGLSPTPVCGGKPAERSDQSDPA
jgi:peptidoglycan/xylan/chitin deacetylase (PgdA/CDA1 family)